VQAQEAVTVLFSSREGTPALRVYRLPKKRDFQSAELWAETSTVRCDPGAPAFEVVEGCEYRFEWSAIPASQTRSTTDPEELFEADDLTGRTGRLRPRLSTGIVDAVLRAEGAPLVKFSFEVRSKKLEYKSEYRWMLRDVAEHMTELVMQRFAASRLAFEVDERRDAETLYEQFEFLRAALQGDRLRQAFARVMSVGRSHQSRYRLRGASRQVPVPRSNLHAAGYFAFRSPTFPDCTRSQNTFSPRERSKP
jgi:hypothetical protein